MKKRMTISVSEEVLNELKRRKKEEAISISSYIEIALKEKWKRERGE